MSLDSHHPLYQRWQFQWKKCRDAVEGEMAVRAGGQLYLDILAGQQDYEYQSYLKRASFYGASDRTLKALTGAILRRPPEINFPGQVTDGTGLLDTIGASNEPFGLLIKRVVEEVITTGRMGVYVDADSESDPDADPYICLYFAENIINWGETVLKGRKILQFVVLLEDTPTREFDGNEDGFEYQRKERYRLLMLEDVGQPTQRLVVKVYERKQENKEEKPNTDPEALTSNFVELSSVEPKFRGGKSIPYIPFAFINPSNNTTEVEKPPILDLVDTNLSHFRNSADYEHGLHYTALPTAWISGADQDNLRFKIGSSIAWVFKEPTARCGFLEFQGHGLGAIKDAMDKKEKRMAVLGARLLEEQKADSEAAAAIRLRHSGEDSVLQHIVKSIDEGLTQVLKWVAEWVSIVGEKISLKLNDQFNPLGLDTQTQLAMVSAVQSGSVSWQTLFYNYKRGNLYPDGWTEEDEKTAIEQGMPLPPPGIVAEDVQLKGGGGPKASIRASASAGEGADLGGGV